MCFYIWASGTALEVSFAAEAIYLRANASYELRVDLLVKNCGADQVDRLHLIYPRSFNLSSLPFDEGLRAGFADETVSLGDRSSPSNRFFDPVYNVQRDGEDTQTTELTFSFLEPDASGKVKPQTIVYSGSLRGDSQLVAQNLSPEENAVLAADGVDCSLLEYCLEAAIAPGESRWLRFRGKVRRVTDAGYSTRLTNALNLVVGRRESHYTIRGPIAVRDILLQKLEGFIRTTDDRIAKATAEALLGALLADLQSASTLHKDWRIHIFPGRFRSLSSMVWQGNVTAPLRDSVAEGIELYSSKTGSHHALYGQVPGDFIVAFKVQQPAFFLKGLAIIAVVLGLAALVLPFFRH